MYASARVQTPKTLDSVNRLIKVSIQERRHPAQVTGEYVAARASIKRPALGP